MSSSNLKWTANEFAKLRFAKYKGYKGRIIAKAMGISDKSVSAAWSKLNHFEHSNMKPNTKIERNMFKGLQLESKVRAGVVDDMKQKWIAELDRARGINTVFTKPSVPREIPDEVLNEGGGNSAYSVWITRQLTNNQYPSKRRSA